MLCSEPDVGAIILINLLSLFPFPLPLPHPSHTQLNSFNYIIHILIQYYVPFYRLYMGDFVITDLFMFLLIGRYPLV